jgi:hypothetical protein
MNTLLAALLLFAQTDVSVTREVVKTQEDLRDALASSAQEKLKDAAASISKAEVKVAREAVREAFPDVKLGASDLDALAGFVLAEVAEIIETETVKIDNQKRALRAAMKAAGIEPKEGAKYALKISGDYARAPEPLADDASPQAKQQRLDELGAMADLNGRRKASVLSAASNAVKKGAFLDVVKSLK